MRIVYLHGFASSPQSGKAQFFQRKFGDLGIPFTVPELDEGNFETMTISGMLRVLASAIASGNATGQKTTLFGSSLGGYVAALYAARQPEQVEKPVLMAPALQFSKRWRLRFSEEQLAEWKTRGWAPFYHYGHKRDKRLGYSFVEDAAAYDGEPAFEHAALILHGTEDAVVPVETSRDFATRHPNVHMREFSSGHELSDVLEPMWAETRKFLEIV